MPLKSEVRRAYRLARGGYRLALRRVFKTEPNQQPTRETREQFQLFLRKLLPQQNPVVCVMGTQEQGLPGKDADLRYADFDIASHSHILDLVRSQEVDAFYVNRCLPRDLVNLVNFLDAYDLKIPILIGERFRCHSLIGYVPVMPGREISTSIRVHHYFAKNYRITDPILCQGSVYEGRRLVDCHQFVVKPDQTKAFEIDRELNTADMEAGMYFLEAIHPQLPTSTSEFRFLGLYRDRTSDFMAGSHSLALGSWHNSARENLTLARTYLPNLDGTLARYVIPGTSACAEGAEIRAGTTLGNQVTFTAAKGRGSFQAALQRSNSSKASSGLEFDRVDPGMPIQGRSGFQTLWLEGRGLAVWHDGGSYRARRKVRKVHAIDPKTRLSSRLETSSMPQVPYDERQETRPVAETLVDLYRSRAKYFLTVFPFLGHSHPDLHLVFDNEQWASNLTNFDIGLYTNDGSVIATKPFRFDGSLTTLNLNMLFAEQLAEFPHGYWAVTAEPGAQGGIEEPGGLEYPSGHKLFGFWGDGTRIYDSVHSEESRNAVAFDLHQPGQSEAAQRTGRMASRCRKFAPFLAGDGQTSWFWVCNIGYSEEKIDAEVKVRVYALDGQEGVTSYLLPANSAKILPAEEILHKCGIHCSQGTIWVESNDCNLGAMWFVQAGDGKGFATDHFTGG